MYILPNIIKRAQPLDPGFKDFKFLIEASQIKKTKRAAGFITPKPTMS